MSMFKPGDHQMTQMQEPCPSCGTMATTRQKCPRCGFMLAPSMGQVFIDPFLDIGRAATSGKGGARQPSRKSSELRERPARSNSSTPQAYEPSGMTLFIGKILGMSVIPLFIIGLFSWSTLVTILTYGGLLLGGLWLVTELLRAFFRGLMNR